ncbi:uncharacterized protein F5891DRAFT_1073069, partial [Suillus fuscotomentosus]
MGEWKEDVIQLISWLDWSMWVKCRLACGFEEMCYYLPTWPFGFFRTPAHHFKANGTVVHYGQTQTKGNGRDH